MDFREWQVKHGFNRKTVKGYSQYRAEKYPDEPVEILVEQPTAAVIAWRKANLTGLDDDTIELHN